MCEDAGGSHSLQLSGIAVPPRGCITSFRTETSRPAEPQDEGMGSKCVASGELGVAVSDPCVLAMHPPSEADAERVLHPRGHCPRVPTQPGLHRSLAKAVPPSCQACRFGVMGGNGETGEFRGRGAVATHHWLGSEFRGRKRCPAEGTVTAMCRPPNPQGAVWSEAQHAGKASPGRASIQVKTKGCRFRSGSVWRDASATREWADHCRGTVPCWGTHVDPICFS